MAQRISYVTLLVRDYDEALAYFKDALGFELIEDTAVTNKRWILLAPSRCTGTYLLLARAVGPDQVSQIGRQAADRVFLFLHTDDFWSDYEAMKRRGVKFQEAPREEPYGIVAVFEDLYGNKWDLLQMRTPE
ncbi:MAG: VOC family protein [Acidobacteria bacterium]|nr:VOC family protein [Acidobacteriota bacterium]